MTRPLEALFSRPARFIPAGLTAIALGLGGCVSLFPTTPPAQLYEFGRAPPPAAEGAAADAGPRINVVLTSVETSAAIRGDQILTLTGDQAAFIAGARWVSPAAMMLRTDMERMFETDARRTRLLPRSDFAGAQVLLRLDFGDLEARYDNGPTAPPVVLVSVRATLSQPGGQPLAQQSFSARAPVADNRIGPILQGFDQATLQVLGQVLAWTETQASLAPPAPPARVTTTTTSTTTVRP